jgi:cobalt/nickel transport system permease protein
MNTLSPAVRRYAISFAAVAVFMSTTAMHIPDGYLSPITSLVMFLLVLPFWAAGLRHMGQGGQARRVPLIALLAAFSFVVMMFNVPLPGGTSGHAVGGALAGILLGPELAAISLSMALIIQALFFGDGGILAIGANCFNMAIVLPFVAAATYRWLAGHSPLKAGRRVIAGAVAGWLGLTLAALLTGVEFGVQPLLFQTAAGAPLYAPYPLAIAVPAMVLPHALVASVIEGVLTAVVIAYLQRSNPSMLETSTNNGAVLSAQPAVRLRWLWIALIMLVVAAPLGLLAPGTAWGEWGTAELTERGLQEIPVGLERLSSFWGAPLANYAVPAMGNASLGYVLSAALGVFLIVLLSWLYMALAGAGAPAAAKRRSR